MGNTFETGRDLEGIEPVEYWESLFLEAYDIGRESVLRRDGGEVIEGGGGAWLGFGAEAAGTGEVTGDEVDDISVIVVMPLEGRVERGSCDLAHPAAEPPANKRTEVAIQRIRLLADRNGCGRNGDLDSDTISRWRSDEKTTIAPSLRR